LSRVLNFVILFSFFAAYPGCGGTANAQAKKATPLKAITSPDSSAKVIDSVIYIDPKTGNQKIINKKPGSTKSILRKPDTIIYIDNGKPRQPVLPPTSSSPKRIDTVIVLKKGKQTKELQGNIAKKDTIKVQLIPESCKCMSFNVKAPDTLRIDDYVNYSFVLKNNCKEHIWVNSASFAFYVFNPDGTPVKVLRKLQYVKQYRYPDFVQVSPGEEYVFDFADDPFFQYDLRPYWQYRFTFAHINTTRKYRPAPSKTYLCREFKDKMIAITSKPRLKK
jgi:hypothetical protein